MILRIMIGCCPQIDARLGEVYWGVYHRHDQHGVELIGDEAVVDAAHVRCPDIEGVGVGSGWSGV